MVHGNGNVQRGQKQTENQRQVAQQTQGVGDEKMHPVVPGHLHKFAEAGRQNNAHRQPVHQQTDPAVTEIHGKAVGPLRVEQLGKGGEGSVYDVRFQHPCGEQRIHVDIIQSSGNLLHLCRVCHAVNKHHSHPGVALSADIALHQLQFGGENAPPYQGGVYTQGLHKGVLAAFQGFLQSGLGYGAHVGSAHLKAQRQLQRIKDNGAVAVGQIIDHVVHLCPLVGGVGVDKALLNQPCTFFRTLRPGSKQIGQRADNVLGNAVPGDHAVQPADLRENLAFQTEIQCPELKITAAGKDVFQIFYGNVTVVLRRLFRVRTGVKGLKIIHVV